MRATMKNAQGKPLSAIFLPLHDHLMMLLWLRLLLRLQRLLLWLLLLWQLLPLLLLLLMFLLQLLLPLFLQMRTFVVTNAESNPQISNVAHANKYLIVTKFAKPSIGRRATKINAH